MTRGRALSSVVLGLLSTGVAFAQGSPDPRIAFTDKAVTASGLTPGKAVIWFGVEHRVDAEYSGDMTQRYAVGTVAADGTARLELPQPPAPRSFWVAVDLDSGALAVAAPDGYRLAKPGKPARLGVGQGAKSDEILDDRPYLMGLMVRPGLGAWSFAGGDGGPRDEDGESNGHLRFATLTIPIGSSYPVDGGFSYNLKLTYNSSPWLFKTVHRVIFPDTDVTRTQASTACHSPATRRRTPPAPPSTSRGRPSTARSCCARSTCSTSETPSSRWSRRTSTTPTAGCFKAARSTRMTAEHIAA